MVYLFYFFLPDSLLRTQLLESDFATNVKLLQHFPETDINVVLQKAAVL